jgi:hypothetical protein
VSARAEQTRVRCVIVILEKSDGQAGFAHGATDPLVMLR